MNRPLWDTFSATMTCEGACGYETDDEETYLSAWQYLIDTGACWGLQGWFGRTASELIDSGQCQPAPKLTAALIPAH